ncbi:hypothetical protein DPX16_10711 [Anabarilius grahami]|uniref:Uncharacterized protein n=1 Tax=Anabarilius grahami TaxID=495550 RepID=A0A3N0Z8K1_ANAGA|nr:hypothetical protein DPX16_10711 [Anabarilius grahami]
MPPAVSVANELAAQPSNAWSAFDVTVAARFQKPSTFPSSTCIDLLWLIHVRYIVQQHYILFTHSSVSKRYQLTPDMPLQNQLQEREEVTRSSDSDLAETLRQSRPAKDEE